MANLFKVCDYTKSSWRKQECKGLLDRYYYLVEITTLELEVRSCRVLQYKEDGM